MEFRTPCNFRFDIPDDWWTFADMKAFSPRSSLYPYTTPTGQEVERVELSDVEPPTRSNGITPFSKYKLLPVLFAFQSPECMLPPVTVARLETNSRHRFRVLNGFHRFFASVAVGYTQLPVVVQEVPNA